MSDTLLHPCRTEAPAPRASTDPAARTPLSHPSSPIDIDADSDQDTIFDEVGRFRDRDALLLEGHTIIQGGSTADTDDTWTFERKDNLRGLSSESTERAVDVQLKHVAEITEAIVDPSSHHEATPARPAERRDSFEDLSDHDLMKLADALSIPDRQAMSRHRLLEKIRASEMRGI